MLPTICPVYLCVNVGSQGATHRYACPALRHSESSPLSLSAREVGLHGLLVVRLPAPFAPHSAISVPPRPCESSPPQCPSPPLLPVWMNVYFLFPWCRTPLPFDFLSVLVVRGGAVCLPTPPSWFSPAEYYYATFSDALLSLQRLRYFPNLSPWDSSAGLCGLHTPCFTVHITLLAIKKHIFLLCPSGLSQWALSSKRIHGSPANLLAYTFGWCLTSELEHSLYVMPRKEEANLHKKGKKGTHSQTHSGAPESHQNAAPH